MYYPTDRIAHTTAFVTPVLEHWVDYNIHIFYKIVFFQVQDKRFQSYRKKEGRKCFI